MKNIIKKHTVPMIIIISWVLFSKISGITCIWRHFFDILCPTCNMTRALLCLLRLDFSGYVNENFMALPMALAVMTLIHTHLFRSKGTRIALTSAAVAITVINLALYLYKVI